MRKPETLYKQPLLWHISGLERIFFAASGRRFATWIRRVGWQLTPYPAHGYRQFYARRPNKRSATRQLRYDLIVTQQLPPQHANRENDNHDFNSPGGKVYLFYCVEIAECGGVRGLYSHAIISDGLRSPYVHYFLEYIYL